MTALLAVGILAGIAFGATYGYVVWGQKASDLAYDLWNAEDEIRRLEADARWNVAWQSEADRLREMHAGTPYIRGRDKYGVWDEDAA